MIWCTIAAAHNYGITTSHMVHMYMFFIGGRNENRFSPWSCHVPPYQYWILYTPHAADRDLSSLMLGPTITLSIPTTSNPTNSPTDSTISDSNNLPAGETCMVLSIAPFAQD